MVMPSGRKMTSKKGRDESCPMGQVLLRRYALLALLVCSCATNGQLSPEEVVERYAGNYNAN